MPLLLNDDTDVVRLWRERAERAEARLLGQVLAIDELSEQVATLSRMLFGQSSEQAGRRVSPGPADDRAAGTSAGDAESGRRPRG